MDINVAQGLLQTIFVCKQYVADPLALNFLHTKKIPPKVEKAYMKAGIILCLWLAPLICWGNELLLEATKQKLSIQKLQGLQVNKECAANSKACLAVLSQVPAESLSKGPEGTVGHPASKFCGVKGGASVILVDEKHNQYDYCVFQQKYYVDSWDLYRKYKK